MADPVQAAGLDRPPPEVSEFERQLEETSAQRLDARVGDRDVGARDIKYMAPADEVAFLKHVRAAVERNHEGLIATIVKTVGNGLVESRTKALLHAKDPFYTEDIVIFGKDGSVRTQMFGQEEKEAPETDAKSHGREEDTLAASYKWPSPQGLEALQRMDVEGGLYLFYVRYCGECEATSETLTFRVPIEAPFGVIMSSFLEGLKLPPDVSLEYFHGPHQVDEKDTLQTLVDEGSIYLDDCGDFVMYAYDDYVDEDSDSSPSDDDGMGADADELKDKDKEEIEGDHDKDADMDMVQAEDKDKEEAAEGYERMNVDEGTMASQY